MRHVLAAILSAFVAAGPAPAAAHSWTELSDGLTSDQIETVLDALEQMADRAGANTWEVDSGKTDPVSLYYAFVNAAPEAVEYSQEVDRVLLTFEALRIGAVGPTGDFSDSADYFEWIEILHPQDVPAVAAHRGRLDAWMEEMQKVAE